MFNETWVPYSLQGLTDGESIALDDLDGFIPYLTEKWPAGGEPHRLEMMKSSRRPNPRGVDGWIVFRLPPREREIDPAAPSSIGTRCSRNSCGRSRSPTEPDPRGDSLSRRSVKIEP